MRAVAYFRLVFFPLWLQVGFIQIGILLNVRETVDSESMCFVEGMTVHFVQCKRGFIGSAKFDEDESGKRGLARRRRLEDTIHVPLALPGSIIPWHSHRIWPHHGTLPIELL